MKRYFPWIVAIAALLVYSNTFLSGFHFDDEFMLRFVADGDKVRSRIFTPRGFGYLTFAANYVIHGRSVVGYHLVNTVIHLLASVLVYKVSLQIFKTPNISKRAIAEQGPLLSLFIALIFAVHPLQTQAVTYIVQRFASLAGMFYLAALWAYFRGRFTKQLGYFALAIGAFVLGLFTKTSAATWPAAVVLCEWLFFTDRKTRAKLIARLWPMMVAAIIPLGLMLSYFKDVIFDPRQTPLGEDLNSLNYFFTQMRVIPKYIQLLFVPMQQNLDHYFPVSQSFTEPAVLFGFGALISLVLIAIGLMKRYPLIAFGILWFFLTLSVTSSFIPIRDVIFEHRLYLPMVGFAFVVVVGLYRIFTWLIKNKEEALKVFTGVMSVVVVLLGVLAFARNFVWKDDIRLMTDVTQKSPQKARGFNWLGLAYQERGDLQAAKANFARAAELNPDYQDAQNNLGNIYSYEGNLEEALKHFEAALEQGGTREQDVRVNMGLAYLNVKDYETAIEYFESVLEVVPDHPLAKEYLELAQQRLEGGK